MWCRCQPISCVLFQPIHNYCKSTFLLLPVLIIWHIWHINFVRRRHNRTIICKLIIISNSVVFIVLAKLNRITIKDKIKIYQSDIPAFVELLFKFRRYFIQKKKKISKLYIKMCTHRMLWHDTNHQSSYNQK
jgi:hypothetical protein